MSLISTSDEIPRLDGRIRQVGHHMLDLRVVLQRIERHVFAEAALLVATVRHLRGDGDMFVDPDRAGLYLRRDAIGAKYVARPDRGRQSIIAVVGAVHPPPRRRRAIPPAPAQRFPAAPPHRAGWWATLPSADSNSRLRAACHLAARRQRRSQHPLPAPAPRSPRPAHVAAPKSAAPSPSPYLPAAQPERYPPLSAGVA